MPTANKKGPEGPLRWGYTHRNVQRTRMPGVAPGQGLST